MDRSVLLSVRVPQSMFLLMFGLALLAATAMLAPRPAHGAPQALGLIHTVEAIPMQCGPNGCIVQLSSFCLQQERRAPRAGIPYHVVAGGLRLHVTGRDGAVRTMRADGLIDLTSAGGNTRIAASLPLGILRRLDASAVALEVVLQTTLIPEADPYDPNPMTLAEQDFAAGPARQLAEGYFDDKKALGHTVNVLDRTINAIGETALLSDRQRRALWARIAGVPLDGAPDGPVAQAAGVFRACLDDIAQHRMSHLRPCLQSRRDGLLIRANVQFWNGLTPGS